MKPTVILTTLMAAALSSAQYPNNLIKMIPSCISGCLSSGIAAACGSGSDWTCACQKVVPSSLLLGQCLKTFQACSIQDQITANSYVGSICIQILENVSITEIPFTSVPTQATAPSVAMTTGPAGSSAGSGTALALSSTALAPAFLPQHHGGAMVAGVAAILAVVV